ncbi:hypothetical protein BKA70DRAFT_1281085 [Coprinopsis sp. MPI-PUGE-AT-0042]|nr:hypothetical protein BKA70DRAFT_1281085 [Coprinopsis sp. MPI-PUGE-AT-0042]
MKRDMKSSEVSGPSRRHPWNDKRHIYGGGHNLRVAKHRQELRQQTFTSQKRYGKPSSKIDFRHIFSYAAEVRHVVPESTTVPDWIWERGYWEGIRKAANEDPLIKPYTPSLEECSKVMPDRPNETSRQSESRPSSVASLSTRSDRDAAGVHEPMASPNVRQPIPEPAVPPNFVWEQGHWDSIRKKVNDIPLVKPFTPSLEEFSKKQPAAPDCIWERGYWESIQKEANKIPLVKPFTPSLDHSTNVHHRY